MSRLSSGDLAPDFALPNPMSGQVLRRSEACRGQDALLVFFRGTWCPFCREQMQVLRENHARLAAAKIAVVGVVCQSSGSVKHYLDTNPLPFPLLVDEARTVAKSYGTHYWVSIEGVNLSQPALFIVDRSDKVTFAHVGRSMRDLPVATVLERFLGFLDSGSADAA